MKLNTYRNDGGNCRAALEFYQQHLGAKVLWGRRSFGGRGPQRACGARPACARASLKPAPTSWMLLCERAPA
ncbi:MAG TPA: hypothetical protein VMV31_05305 [Terriglobales bacterium]|nr:hypothetical protein [Terriglobales bacterium]